MSTAIILIILIGICIFAIINCFFEFIIANIHIPFNIIKIIDVDLTYPP